LPASFTLADGPPSPSPTQLLSQDGNQRAVLGRRSVAVERAAAESASTDESSTFRRANRLLAMDYFERVEAVVLRLREIDPVAVPSRVLQSLYVHDDSAGALASVDLTEERRAGLPADLREELEALALGPD
jgi:hypothetical protein